MQASTECRMILCLDDHYAHHPVIDGKTIGQYQEWLSHHLADKIEVRMAADCYNRKALAMCFAANSNFYKYLVSQLNKNPGFKHQRIAEANESGRSFPVIFMSLEYLDDLVKTIQSFNAEQNAVPHNGVRMFEGGVVNEVEKKPESTSVITKRIV